jgi:hypothetical protein
MCAGDDEHAPGFGSEPKSAEAVQQSQNGGQLAFEGKEANAPVGELIGIRQGAVFVVLEKEKLVAKKLPPSSWRLS